MRWPSFVLGFEGPSRHWIKNPALDCVVPLLTFENSMVLSGVVL